MSNRSDPYVQQLLAAQAPAAPKKLPRTLACPHCISGDSKSIQDLEMHLKIMHPTINQTNLIKTENSSPANTLSQAASISSTRVRNASSDKADAGGSRSASDSAPSERDASANRRKPKRARQPDERSPSQSQQRASKTQVPGTKFLSSASPELPTGSDPQPRGLRREAVDATMLKRPPPGGADPPPPTRAEPTSKTARATLGKKRTSTALSRVQPAVSRDIMHRFKHNPLWPNLILQPESREISQEQLAAEVKSIYTGLTMVETKCIHIDKAQAATPRSESKITDEHWQAMIALHRTLLHEHHDFFLASQHPSASPALKRLALKYSMPARMWKHGIHSFLELLRHRLPESLDYMLAFIYLSYQMMALLFETVDSFRTTWVECLGDLGRYRMAVEDEDIRDREIWAGVARSWYNKAADTNPAIGRLWHHLAILARPHMLQQVYLYNRSLTSVVPFLNARESITTIFDPVLAENSKLQISTIDLDFLRINALLFKRTNLGALQELIPKYVQQLDSTISELGDRWRETGAFTIIAIIGTLYEFGNQTNAFRFLSDQHRKRLQLQDPTCAPQGLPDDQSVQDLDSLSAPDELSLVLLPLAIRLFVSTVGIALSRRGDINTLAAVNISLTFLFHLYQIHEAYEDVAPIVSLLDMFDWPALGLYLNTLLTTEDNIDRRFQEFILFEEAGRALPEDWMLRGLTFSFGYFPRDWFKNAAESEEAERYIELTSTTKARIDRVLSLGAKLAQVGTHLSFDNTTGRFNVPGGDIEMEDEGYGSVLGEDSPEMREYHENERSALNKFQQRTAIGTTQRSSIQYSSIITGVDVLENTALFEELGKIPLPIIVPEQAITDLLQAAKEEGVQSKGAAVAISNLRTALQDYKREIRIDNDDGVDVTKKYLQSPSAFTLPPRQNPNEFVHKGPLQRAKTMQDALESIVRRETVMSLRRTDTGTSSIAASTTTTDTDITEMGDDEDLRPAPKKDSAQPPPRPLLITDNKQLRARADQFGAAALAGWLAKRWLEQGRRRSIASARLTSVDTAMDIDATAAEPAPA